MTDDPIKVDPRHYKVEFENDQVRVLRIRYGPHEKSVMHSHPDGYGVFLTDHHGRFTYPDGKTEELRFRAGEFYQAEAGRHAPENLSGEPFELIQVEFKPLWANI